MLRKLLIAGALAALVAVPTASAARRQALLPDLTYEQQVQFTMHGPVTVHVLTAPRPGGLWSLQPVLSNETIPGTERVTEMQVRLAGRMTAAGVNGDLFSVKDGYPTGILMRSGALDHAPVRERSSIGVDTSGNLRVDRVTLLGTWQGTGPRRTFAAVNAPPGSNGVALFTPAWGPATPPGAGSVEVVLQPFPPAKPNGELPGTVTQVGAGAGVAIPADGAVLVARGTATARLQAEAPAGQAVRIRLVLRPDWSGVSEALGGGPVLVRNGAAVFRADELFTTEQILPRHPRTAVGQLADGRIVLIAVDGREPAYSTGMTNFELAQTLVRLGAVTGAALDAGGATTMAFEGRLLNRPSDPSGERPVAEALLVAYSGVYAPPPALAVVSPNGGVTPQQQQLAYKLVRPSSVGVSLLGPDGVARYTFSGQQEPGTYPFIWVPRTPEGAPEPEGQYRWVVSATDDLGRPSTAEQTFAVNGTLAAARAVLPRLAVPRRNPRAVAAFTLARPAVVTARIETRTGVVLRTLPAVQAAAGTFEVAWDGVTDTGAVVYTGRYVARAVAENELGKMELAVDFPVVRRTPVGPSPSG